MAMEIARLTGRMDGNLFRPQKVIIFDKPFKNNDQLKTNTALQMEGAKIEFKVI
jgi:hypothetical protein